MNSQANFQTAFVDRLQSTAGELLDRASKAEGRERVRVWQWLLAAAALFLVWRMGRSMKKLFWTLFGVAMAVYWSGGFALLLR